MHTNAPAVEQSFSNDEVQSRVHVEKWQLVRKVVCYVEAEISKNESAYRQLANPNNDQIIQYFATKSELLKLKLMLNEELHALTMERKNERVQVQSNQQGISVDQDRQWGGPPIK